MLNAKTITALTALLAVFACLISSTMAVAAEPDAAAFTKCDRACIACARACAACHRHCLAMIKSGDKTHKASAALSSDCLEICNVTERLVARKGPLTATICEACVKACDACGAECGKDAGMAPMAECKKACDACSAACKDLISKF